MFNNYPLPWAWMGSKAIAHDAEGWMGCWLRGHEGERNNCFRKIQLVGKKNLDKTTLASKMRFSRHCLVRLRPTEAVLVFATVWNSLNERKYLSHLATDHPKAVTTRRAQKNWWWDDQSGKSSTGRYVESFPCALSFSLTLRCIFQICLTVS